MIADKLFWLSGFSLTLGGCLTFMGWIMFAILDTGHQFYQHPRWYPLNLLVIVGGLLMAMGLPGFYVRQASEAGIGGLIGFVLLFPYRGPRHRDGHHAERPPHHDAFCLGSSAIALSRNPDHRDRNLENRDLFIILGDCLYPGGDCGLAHCRLSRNRGPEPGSLLPAHECRDESIMKLKS